MYGYVILKTINYSYYPDDYELSQTQELIEAED
jgi:hypothetical protein